MIKGVIFDMDGVLSDTQKLHSQIESELLNRFGIGLTPAEITKRYAGVKTRTFFDELLRMQSKPYDIDLLMEEKWHNISKLARMSVDAIEGSVPLVKNFYNSGLPLAVASASDFSYVSAVLEKLGIKEYFKVVITGDMVKNGKPDPESFLTAAEKIQISPEFCLVIEDGISGMQAAKSAGMKCVGLVNDPNENFPTPNLVKSLLEITDEFLRNLK